MPGMDEEAGYIPPKTPFITTYRSADYNTLSLPYKHTSSNSSKASLPSTSPQLSPVNSRSPLLHRRDSTFSVSSRSSRRRKAPPIHYLPALIALVLLTVTVIAWLLSGVPCGIPHICRESFSDVLARNTGTYAPFRERHYHQLPATCKVDQVSIVSRRLISHVYRRTKLTGQLHRHTARYPTKSAAKRLKATLSKIAARRIKRPSQRELGFLLGADLDLKEWDLGELTDQGRWE